jgi:hypothetical protein
MGYMTIGEAAGPGPLGSTIWASSERNSIRRQHGLQEMSRRITVTDLTRGTRAQLNPRFWREYVDISVIHHAAKKSATNRSPTRENLELSEGFFLGGNFGFDGC